MQNGALAQVVLWLDQSIETSHLTGKHADELRHVRNKAILWLGFGVFAVTNSRLQIEHVDVVSRRMSCYFPQTKADRQFTGQQLQGTGIVPIMPSVGLSGLD
jgi:hypothetical protein